MPSRAELWFWPSYRASRRRQGSDAGPVDPCVALRFYLPLYATEQVYHALGVIEALGIIVQAAHNEGQVINSVEKLILRVQILRVMPCAPDRAVDPFRVFLRN